MRARPDEWARRLIAELKIGGVTAASVADEYGYGCIASRCSSLNEMMVWAADERNDCVAVKNLSLEAFNSIAEDLIRFFARDYTTYFARGYKWPYIMLKIFAQVGTRRIGLMYFKPREPLQKRVFNCFGLSFTRKACNFTGKLFHFSILIKKARKQRLGFPAFEFD